MNVCFKIVSMNVAKVPDGYDGSYDNLPDGNLSRFNQVVGDNRSESPSDMYWPNN